MKRILVLCLLAAVAFSGFADAENQEYKRVALVIGNSNYRAAPLANPVNDANDVSALLSSQGFDVTKLINSDRRSMIDGIRNFGNKLDNETIALFYYAGHAVQLNGENFLIPVNAPIQREEDVEFEAVSIDRVIRTMEQNEAYMNLVFLDACRDNPFLSSSRSASRGLSVVAVDVKPQTAGAMIAFATAPGSTAADGDGRNGVFTQAFLKYAKEPGLEINQMLLKVRREVLESTNGIQIPWTDVSLIREFYFNPQPEVIEEPEPIAQEIQEDLNPTSEVIATDVKPVPLPSDAPTVSSSDHTLAWSLIAGGALSTGMAVYSYAQGAQKYENYMAETNRYNIPTLREQMALDSGMVWTFSTIAVSTIATGTIMLLLGE